MHPIDIIKLILRLLLISLGVKAIHETWLTIESCYAVMGFIVGWCPLLFFHSHVFRINKLSSDKKKLTFMIILGFIIFMKFYLSGIFILIAPSAILKLTWWKMFIFLMACLYLGFNCKQITIPPPENFLVLSNGVILKPGSTAKLNSFMALGNYIDFLSIILNFSEKIKERIFELNINFEIEILYNQNMLGRQINLSEFNEKIKNAALRQFRVEFRKELASTDSLNKILSKLSGYSFKEEICNIPIEIKFL